MNLVERLIELDSRDHKRILVVGDGMRDVYVHGTLEDKSQDGCRKFTETERRIVPGGAANVVRSLENWSVEVIYFSRIRVPVKTRFMVDHKCIFRHDCEKDDTDSEIVRYDSMNALASASPKIYAVILSDYDKGTLTSEFIRDVASVCKDQGIPCVADAKREPDTYHGCILKCNSEYQIKHPQELHGFLSKHWLVVTYGEMNPILWDNSSPVGLGYNLPRVPCLNHVGAGDCFTAHLALGLAYGFDLKEAVALAHSAGRVYVQFPHNRPPQPSEMAADMAGETLRIA